MLGNHGNEHRDFKLASKVDLASVDTFEVIAPTGRRYDLKARLTDVGYMPKEGFWTTKFVPDAAGLYIVAQTSDRVVQHGQPTRSIRSAKTLFVASASLDHVPRDNPGFDRPLGHPLELVPVVNPVTPMGPGTPVKVRLLFRGKPLAGATVSFIPRGETLTEGTDQRFERLTDREGGAAFVPTEGNYYLIVAHRTAADEKGKGYTETQYSATLCVFVPQKCPCCGE
jgi:hypothetical protein